MNHPEQRFLCPHCRQKLSCEDGYGGWSIQCPKCSGGVVVPLMPSPPVGFGVLLGVTPPPLGQAHLPAAASTPGEKWWRRTIVGASALVFAWLMVHFFGNANPRSHYVIFPFDVIYHIVSPFPLERPWTASELVAVDLLYVVLYALVFAGVAVRCARYSDSLLTQVGGGFLLLIVFVGFLCSFFGGLNAGCGAGCGNPNQSLLPAFRLFGWAAFFLAILQFLVNTLKRR